MYVYLQKKKPEKMNEYEWGKKKKKANVNYPVTVI